MAQRVLILVGPDEGGKADTSIADFAAQYGWRVSTTYVTEDGGELRSYDPTPLYEVMSISPTDRRNNGSHKREGHSGLPTLGDMQREPLLVAWRMFGGWVRVGDDRSPYKHGTLFKELCAVMRARGLRFADAEPPEVFYTNRQWRESCGLSQGAANVLVGNQVANPAMLAPMDDDHLHYNLDACFGEREREIIALHARLQSKH